MPEIDYKEWYDRVGAQIGWDFGSLRCRVENAAWDFYEAVAKYCDGRTVLLDIGCGGGEKLIGLAAKVFLLIGIDASTAMIQAAQNNLLQTGLTKVRFFQMRAQGLMFPDGFFQCVSCRHCSFDPGEVAKVLAKDGVFLTQQVGEGDKLNIKQAFGRGQNFEQADGTQKAAYERELKQAGFREVQALEYDAAEYYQTAGDLLFLLKHAPIVPDFGEVPGDWEIFRRLVAEFQTGKGIYTNAKRYLLIARK